MPKKITTEQFIEKAKKKLFYMNMLKIIIQIKYVFQIIQIKIS